MPAPECTASLVPFFFLHICFATNEWCSPCFSSKYGHLIKLRPVLAHFTMEAYSHRHNQSFHPSLSPNPPQTFSAFQTPPGLSIDDAGYPLSLVTPPHSAPAASPQFNIPSTLLYDSRRRRMQQFSSSRQQETYGAGYGRHGSMHDNMQNALPCGCDVCLILICMLNFLLTVPRCYPTIHPAYMSSSHGGMPVLAY